MENRVKLEVLCNVQAGGTPARSKKEYWENGTIPWVKISDISEKNLSSTEETITEKGLNSSSAKIFPKGTLLYTIFATLGEVCILNIDAATNQAIAGIQIENDSVEREYLYYFLTSLKEHVNKIGRGVAQNNINMTILRNIDIPLPERVKQKKIADTLTCVDTLIDKRKRQLVMLDELVKSRFVEMFGDPTLNPMRWNQVPLSDVCSSVVRGPFGSALKKEYFVEPNETTYKVYEQKNAIQKSAAIGTYYITKEKYQELKRFECLPGDILMSCSGTMGKLYQLPSNCEKGIINQALCKFTLNDCILPIYFLMYMSQTIGQLETKGSGIQNIAAVSFVKKMPINLPPLPLQQQFADFVSRVDGVKESVRRSLEELEILKKSLLQEYFS